MEGNGIHVALEISDIDSHLLNLHLNLRIHTVRFQQSVDEQSAFLRPLGMDLGMFTTTGVFVNVCVGLGVATSGMLLVEKPDVCLLVLHTLLMQVLVHS